MIDIAHRRSVAVLCILHKVRYNPLHPYCGALHVPFVPVRVTLGALFAHIGILKSHLAAEPGSTAGLLFHLSASLWNDLDYPVFDGI